MFNVLKKSCPLLILLFALLLPTSLAKASDISFCFIGDSRFVGMEQAVPYHSNITWIAKVSMGNQWYWDNIDTIQSLDRNTVIIYSLGVNDLDANSCIEALKNLRDLGFNHVYFTGVTPVNEFKASSYGYSRTNAQIINYNNIVYNNLPDGVAMMDSYEYLMNMGFNTVDGIHYTDDTYNLWFYNIMNSL